ncbi:hypothetical protein M8J77_007187 [Diaphorina citri]|nr:hypothetical protein M8J77_007187 [Diaphorina citri]
MTSVAEQSDSYRSYVLQLEKRVLEQEQLISLLNEKLAALTRSKEASSGASSSLADVVGGKHVKRKQGERSSVSFMGSRESAAVPSVVPTKYTQYFASRIDPNVSAEAFARDLMSGAEGLTSVKCSKMKTKHSSYASFHIVIPADQCPLVETDAAWPQGSFIKIFEGRLLPNFIMESYDSNASQKPTGASGGGKKPATKKLTGTTKSAVVTSSPVQGTGSAAGTSGASRTTKRGVSDVAATTETGSSPKNSRPQRNVDSSHFLLGCVYIPPNSGHEVYAEHCSVVEELSCRFPDAKVILAGDYNLPDATWSLDEESSMIVDCDRRSPAVSVCESFNSISLSQVNSLSNSHGKFLDLLFSSECIATERCLDPILADNFHHNSFSFNIPVPNQLEQLAQNMLIFDFAKCDISKLKEFFESVDWSFLSSCDDIERATLRFYELLTAGIEISTPLKRVHYSSFPVWFSRELRSLVLKKKEAHRVYKQTRLESDYVRFSSLRSRCCFLNRKFYKEYMKKSDRSLKTNPRFFWKFVNMTRKTDGLPKNMFLGNETSSSGQESANLFAKSFSSAYITSDASVPDYPLLDRLDFNGVSFSSVEVFRALSSLPLKFSSGPDNVPPYILRKCASCLADPLSILFNKSLLSGKFPSSWKSSFVFPIHKSGDRSNISNYRGVCIQSAIPKVLDKLVSSKLSFACRHFICDQQHGFTAKRSTSTNLLCYQQDILSSFQAGNDVHAVYTDVAKAFDRVNTAFLIAKLRSYGIGESFLTWLESAFHGRTQRVKIGDCVSASICVTSGVGQGSHSGPLFFSLFFNDLPNFIRHSRFQMYADDVKMYRSVSDFEDCTLLQQDLDSFYRWLNFNGLQLTLHKCAFIYFSRRREAVTYQYHLDSQPLNQVDVIQDLGVLLDSKLSFSVHIENLCMRSHRLLGYVFRSSKGLSFDSFKLLYLSLVRSLLEYACVIWSPYYNVYGDMLDRVQKRFLWYSTTRFPQSQVDIESLSDRRVRADTRFLQNLIRGSIDCTKLLDTVTLTCHRRLRREDTFYVPKCKTNYLYYSPLNRMLRTANDNIDFIF